MSYTETFKDSTGKTRQLSLRFHREARLRYKVAGPDSLKDTTLLKQLLDHFLSTQLPRVQELMDYAQGNNHIVSMSGRRKEEDMSDNRAVHNFGGMMSVFKQGYLVGNPIRVTYNDDDEESTVDKLLTQLDTDNNFYDLNRALVLDLSQTGRAFELVYRSQKDQTKVKRLDPREAFVIYNQDIEEEPLAGVRVYSADLFDKDKLMVELYTATSVKIFEYKGDLTEISDTPHAFGLVPLVEYQNTNYGMGDYEPVLSLIDLYDASQSDTANYMTDLADAILAIFGRVSFPDNVSSPQERIDYMRKMRKARLLNLEPPIDEDGNEGRVGAQYLYKQYDVDGTEAYKKRIVNDIHKFANVPDLTDEHFSGTQSGEAMKWKVFGLDQERISMQALFEVSLRRRYQLLMAIEEISRAVTGFDSSQLQFTFTPNLPADTSSIVGYAKQLYGLTSDQTVLEILEGVTGVDAAAEQQRLADQDGTAWPETRLGDDYVESSEP